MALEPWLPIGQMIADGVRSQIALFEGPNWQIVETHGSGRVLLVRESLADRWSMSGLVEEGVLARLIFGDQNFRFLSSNPNQVLCPVAEAQSPQGKSDALAFALALNATRTIDKDTPLQDAIYVEKISRLLPTYSISSRTDDPLVLGYWLTGGANVSAQSFRRLHQMTGWLGVADVKEIVRAARLKVAEAKDAQPLSTRGTNAPISRVDKADVRVDFGRFTLPGRPELESFFNEHVVDIVENSERYKALGIGFPGAVVLHGPPGCGKTFAVEKLVEFLGWPSFQIDASSIGSPYIHETSRKVAKLFEEAMNNAPSVLVIDEMEAFLADRAMGSDSSHHRIEEVGEFLRRIPEATKNEVLIVAMTNRIEMIDPAVLRRGRFDHIIKLDHASEAEVRALLEKLLSEIPSEDDVETAPLAKRLAGRPLSDVAFVVREAARLSARAGRDRLNEESLVDALSSTAVRQCEDQDHRRIGFL